MKKYSYIVLIISAIILVGCKSTDSIGKTDINSFDKYAITNIFLDAKRNLQRGDRSSAIDGFELCIKRNPRHDASFYELARINEYQSPKKAIEYISAAIEISDSNIWYKEFLIGILKQQKRYDDALDINKDLIKLKERNKEYYYQRANLYIYNKNFKKANNTYDDILKLFGYEEGILLQKKQIYLKKGEYKKAIIVLQKLIDHNPNEKKYYGMIAEIYVKQNKKAEAMQYYQKILEIDPDDGFVHLALADYYKSEGKPIKSADELQLAMASESLKVDAKINMLLRLMKDLNGENNKSVQFEELLLIATNTNANNPKILALNADYNNEKGNTKKAIIYYREILSIDSSKFTIWEQLLLAEEKIKDNKALLKESQRALRLFPQHASIYYFNAKANIEYGNWKEVKLKAKMGINFVYTKEDRASFLALRAKAEMHLGEIDNAMANYRSALSIDNQNAKIMKDYAYYLALNERDLSTSLEYSKNALEIESNNAEYIYVYAYCLFKDGQKQEALKWIKPAMVKFPENKKLQLLDMEINKNE